MNQLEIKVLKTMIQMLKDIDSQLSVVTISDYKFKSSEDGMKLLENQQTEIFGIKRQISEVNKWIETILESQIK